MHCGLTGCPLGKKKSAIFLRLLSPVRQMITEYIWKRLSLLQFYFKSFPAKSGSSGGRLWCRCPIIPISEQRRRGQRQPTTHNGWGRQVMRSKPHGDNGVIPAGFLSHDCSSASTVPGEGGEPQRKTPVCDCDPMIKNEDLTVTGHTTNLEAREGFPPLQFSGPCCMLT